MVLNAAARSEGFTSFNCSRIVSTSDLLSAGLSALFFASFYLFFFWLDGAEPVCDEGCSSDCSADCVLSVPDVLAVLEAFVGLAVLTVFDALALFAALEVLAALAVLTLLAALETCD